MRSKICFICGQCGEALGKSWASIFENSRTIGNPRNYHIRLAKVLEIPPLQKEKVESYYCICRGCIRRLQKIERGQRILHEFRQAYKLRFQRVKRDSTDSLGEKRVRQRMTTTKKRSKTTQVVHNVHGTSTSTSEEKTSARVHIVNSQQFVQPIQSQQNTQNHIQSVLNQLQQQTVQTTASNLQTSQSSNQLQVVKNQQQSPIKPPPAQRRPLLRPLRSKPSLQETQISGQTLQLGQQNLQIQQLLNGQFTLTNIPQSTQHQCIVFQAVQQPQVITLPTLGLGNVQGIPQTITLPIQGQTVGQQFSGDNIVIQTPQGLQTIQPGQALYQNPLILGANNEGVQTSQIQPRLTVVSQQQQTTTTDAITTMPHATTIGGQHTAVQTATLGSIGEVPVENSVEEEFNSADDCTEDSGPDPPVISLQATIKTEEPDEDIHFEANNTLATVKITIKTEEPDEDTHFEANNSLVTGNHLRHIDEITESEEPDQGISCNPKTVLEDGAIDDETSSEDVNVMQRANVECLDPGRGYTGDESINGIMRSIQSTLPLKTQDRGERLFQCSYCKKRFLVKVALTRHERIHTGDRPFQCRYCERRFNFKQLLTYHERIHTGERAFPCGYCEKRFVSKKGLIFHERFHRGERPFQCSHCEERFITKYRLINHERIHTGEPFQCSYCEKGFMLKGDQKKHEHVHTGERPF